MGWHLFNSVDFFMYITISYEFSCLIWNLIGTHGSFDKAQIAFTLQAYAIWILFKKTLANKFQIE